MNQLPVTQQPQPNVASASTGLMSMPLMPTAPVPPSSLTSSTLLPPPPSIASPGTPGLTGSPILSSALTSPSKMMSPPPVPRTFMPHSQAQIPHLPTQPLAAPPRLSQPAGGPILASMLQRKPTVPVPNTQRVVVNSNTVDPKNVIRKTVTLTASQTSQPQTTTPCTPPTSKEGLYIVALQGGHPLRQGQNMVVLKQDQSPMSTSSTSTADSPMRLNESSPVTSTASPTNSQTDRRNVAEILASLSCLTPELPQSIEQPNCGGVTITPITTTAAGTGTLNNLFENLYHF